MDFAEAISEAYCKAGRDLLKRGVGVALAQYWTARGFLGRAQWKKMVLVSRCV